MFDHLKNKNTENLFLRGTVFGIQWKKDEGRTFAQVGPISVDYISPNPESFWDTIRNDENIASYRTIGGDLNPFVSKYIEQDGQFWHSKVAKGDRGVEIEFKQRVAVECLTFQTRQDSGKFIEFKLLFSCWR